MSGAERPSCNTTMEKSCRNAAFGTKERLSINWLGMGLVQLMVFAFMIGTAYAQTDPPYVQWQYTGEAQLGDPTGEDWIYDVIETPDGGFLSAGFSDNIAGFHLPSYVKVDGNGNYLWDQIVSMGLNYNQGNFQVVKELDNGHFVLFGNKQKTIGTTPPIDADYLILHEIDASGNAISGFPKLFLPNIADADMAFGFSLQLEKNSQGVVIGYTVTGLYKKRIQTVPEVVYGPEKGFIMEIDKNGIETGFGSKSMIDPTAVASEIRNHKNTYSANGVHNGYVLCGDITDANNPERDVYLTKLDLNGAKLWEKRFTKAQLVASGVYVNKFDYFNGTKELETGEDSYYTACEGTLPYGYVNDNERAFDVVQAPDQNIIVNAYFDYYNCSDTGSNNGIFTGEYLATNAVIIKVNPTNGEATSAENYRYFAGFDYYSRMKILENLSAPSDYHIVVIGNNPHMDENGIPIRMMGELLMLDNTGTRQWYKQFNDNSEEYCMFGLTLTSDGGYVVGGNNEMDVIVNGAPIETENYVAIKLSPDCPEFNVLPLNITENTEWVIPKRIKQDVFVKQGATLTIKDEVYFSKDAHLIVEAGAKLELVGALLTNSCDAPYWPGIQVWGTSLGAQNPVEQGWVLMSNSTIENAETGIVANNYYTLNAWQPGYRGGIVQANSATFRNCNIAVQFDAYEPFSVSYFTNCSFVTDENYWLIGEPLAANPFAFAKLTSHRGVVFANCTFQNEVPELFGTQSRGTGILSTNGGFSVKDGCSFTDLYYGIYAMDVLAQNTFYVHDASFSSYRGIYMSSCYNNQIDGSTFVVPVSITGVNNEAYGLYMEYSTGYAIEDNRFTSAESTPTGIGVYINNSGTDDNEIYRNDFSNLQYSIVAKDINRRNTVGGLVIKCNTFYQTVSDISVVGGYSAHDVINQGIAYHQGALSTDPTQMAGNLFYYNTSSIDFDDLNNGLNYFNYYYPSNVKPGFGNVNPQDITFNTVTKQGTTVNEDWYFNLGCPSHTGGIGTLRSQMATAGQQADSTASVLALLVDGGDTPLLTNEVQQSTPPQTVTMYNELMATSPYLSDSVVESAIVKEDVLPNALLRDIMVANAHSSKSEVLMTTLDSRANPMPDYMKAQILQGRSLVSLKEETEARLGAYRLNEARALYGLSRHFMTDTLNPLVSTDSLIGLLAGAYTLNAKYQLALLYLNQGDYSLGSNVLNNVPALFPLSADELIAHQNMLDYYDWLVAVKQGNGNILNPDSTQQQQLWDIAQADSSGAGVYARNLLVTLDETTYNEPIVLPDIYKSTRAMEDYDKLLHMDAPNFLKVFPNPAKDYIILEYKLETDVFSNISIHDIKGTTIKSIETKGQVDQITLITSDWKPGIYIANLKINGKTLDSIKFTIVE